jgi:hypothetical protein
MRHEHGEKLGRCEELVITPESGVKLATLVVDHAVFAVGEPLERNGWAFDILEKRLEGFSISGRYPARGVEIETRMTPAPEKLDTLGGDGLALEHHSERPLTEDRLERREVEIAGRGVEGAFLVEDAEGGDRVQMGVGYL